MDRLSSLVEVNNVLEGTGLFQLVAQDDYYIQVLNDPALLYLLTEELYWLLKNNMHGIDVTVDAKTSTFSGRDFTSKNNVCRLIREQRSRKYDRVI